MFRNDSDANPLAVQYNAVASEFDASYDNKDSNAAYFEFFPASLQGKLVLDLGCGNGCDITVLKQRQAYMAGIDAAKEMVTLAQRNNPNTYIKQGLFESIPFQDNSFDFVISKWAFQTSAEIDPIYKEISRVLKINGELIYLACHPMRQFMEKNTAEKNYFKQEIFTSTFFEGRVTVKEPSHTMNDYLSPTFFKHFSLLAFKEGHDASAEKINNETYPSYFIVHAQKK